mmetsp:Transcript_26965/g.80858  ORF Transcript_26965/g.80858 Transcript_26965/m.80858 type:complete len:91 (-) Transcript_26965:14-286(-)
MPACRERATPPRGLRPGPRAHAWGICEHLVSMPLSHASGIQKNIAGRRVTTFPADGVVSARRPVRADVHAGRGRLSARTMCFVARESKRM